jgi:hypothetical protein
LLQQALHRPPGNTFDIYLELSTMRLINTKTLELAEFTEKGIPSYVILSHTWGDGEVSYEQMQTQDPESLRCMPGYTKIVNFCHQALSWKFEWAWVDTCCIDKRSSSELSEAINSMFNWYRSSSVCFVYLVDVYTRPESGTGAGLAGGDWEDGFCSARWFTRGWCLQELLAPRNLHFFDSSWTHIGTKMSLHRYIHNITGISEDELFAEDLSTISVARRMSWAARRETTRTEDIAYCLLGIFDINMPLLYGEGAKAFKRLQEEIIRVIDDQSIFAWTLPEDDDLYNLFTCLFDVLAPHPIVFEKAGNISRSDRTASLSKGTGSHSVSNKGVRLNVPLVTIDSCRWGQRIAVLECHYKDDSNYLGILVSPFTSTILLGLAAPIMNCTLLTPKPPKTLLLRSSSSTSNLIL